MVKAKSFDDVIMQCRRTIGKATKNRTNRVFAGFDYGQLYGCPAQPNWSRHVFSFFYEKRRLECVVTASNTRKKTDPDYHPGQTLLECQVYRKSLRAADGSADRKLLVTMHTTPLRDMRSKDGMMWHCPLEAWIPLVEAAMLSLEIKVLEQKRNNTW